MLNKRTLPLVAIAITWIWTLMPAYGQDVSFSSETILRGIQQNPTDKSDRTFFPLFEYLGVDYDLKEENKEGVSLHFYGWARGEFSNDAYYQEEFDGDLIYGYIDYYKPQIGLRSCLGRQHVSAGITNESVDGILIEHRLGDHFSALLYGGLPEEFNQTDGLDGDITYGGRVAYLFWPQYEVGLSYQNIQNHKLVVDENAGLDTNFQKDGWIVVNGLSGYNLQSHIWREHHYDLSLAVEDFQFEPTYQYFRYKDYFPQNDIQDNPYRFLQDSDETINIYGTDLIYNAIPEFQIGIRGLRYDYKLRKENSEYLSWLLTINTFSGDQIGAEVGHMDGDTADNFYDLYRCYVYWQDPLQIELVDYISADALLIKYHEPINDKDNSFQLSLAGGARFLKDLLETRLSIIYSRDPYLENDLSGIATMQIKY